MRRVALTLCRVLSLLACFVCAGGYTTSASAQSSLFVSSSGLPDGELCHVPDRQEDPAGDFGSSSPGGDFAEHDDDDDCSEEPTALVIDARPEPAPWEPGRPQRVCACAPLISDHHTLEPRPPRAI